MHKKISDFLSHKKIKRESEINYDEILLCC